MGAHSTLVVDTGSNYFTARTIDGYARCAKPDNGLIAVNTEPHFDHIGGNGFFRSQGIDIWAHPKLRRIDSDFLANCDDFDETIRNEVRRAARESRAFYLGTELANPNCVLKKGQRFDLGGLDVVVYETPGHTPLNISLFVPSEGVLYCGDTIVTGYIPNLEGGDVAAWKDWQQSLTRIDALNPQHVVPGHGDIISGASAIAGAIARMQDTLNRAIETQTAPTR